ncbi:MAG: reprolysin-like metallopeptidase [Candidatus Promineifilaceae bacterium]
MKKLLNKRFLFRLGRVSLIALFFALGLVVLSGATSAASLSNQSADGVWADIADGAFHVQGERQIVPETYRTVSADLSALAANLAQAPMEFTSAAQNNQVTITLPLPDGSYQDFYLYESPVMHPDLAAEYPEIKTYTVKGVEDAYATGRVDLTLHGFHAMVLSPKGTFYIDPYSQRDTAHYISYYTADFSRDSADIINELPPLGESTPIDVTEGGPTSGPTLRTYRLALATTGEYSTYHGGTKPLVLSEMVTAINRVTGIYEREVAIRLEMIANEDDIIFLDANTDPYTNNNGSAMLGQNQTTLDTIIGTANYDIGHVFSTGGGGVAFLNAVCNPSNKARGVTGLSNPVGDPFYVDYVAHEMGHQHGGNHPFNGNAGSCSGGNRNPSTAFEPGSGSTIMAYAGICGNQDLQPHSDDYFHTISFQEIAIYTQSGGGSACGTTMATGNNPPSVDAGTGGFVIPINTPFMLTGSATDPDSDPLTYNWEEFDLGPAGHPDNPVGNAPIFRSFPSVSDPTRIFPKLDDIVNNTHTIGELLPSYSRNLTFRLTARDNHVSPSAGGVAYDQVAFTVSDAAGPFVVTSPNNLLGGTTWPGSSTQEVTWDVANTDAAPVNCSSVNIDLSVDGGYTISENLATGVANDGSAPVIVPNISTTTARIWVSCSDNIFFDMSDEDFTIVPGDYSYIYMPAVFTAEANANSAPTASLPALGLSAVFVGGAMMVVIGRRK